MNTHKQVRVNFLLLLVVCMVLGIGATVLLRFGQVQASAQDLIWREVTADSVSQLNSQPALGETRFFGLNVEALKTTLNNAPVERLGEPAGSFAVLTIPMPNGKLSRFRIQESTVMEPALAERYPEIKSYRGQGIDDPAATMRADWSPLGFHALVLVAGETFTVLPSAGRNSTIYASSNAKELTDKLRCEVDESKVIYHEPNTPQAVAASVGGTLRTYRIAIATTSEYSTQFGNGDVGQTIASINVWLNAANAIYERELAIRMVLVGNNSQVIYTSEPDPFSNGDGIAMLGQVRTTLRDRIGSANYDFGHVFGTGGAGVAYVGVVCSLAEDATGPYKGGGVSLMGGAVGNSTYVGLWTHEMGHQFGASHSFNGTASFCGGSNRSSGSAYESGGGSTIMSYAGVCDSDNIVFSRDLRFHSKSFDSITGYLGAGACAQTSATGNNVPTVNGGADFTIPKNTPFTLTATGGDADAGDVANLRYSWEQYDSGGTSYANPPYDDSGDTNASTRPIFRAFPIVALPSRTFPSLTYILNNANDPPDFDGSGLRTAEELPRIGRSLNFRVTIRDQRGGVNTDDVLLQVAGNAGPFVVTVPESPVTWTGGTSQTVSWSVAGTTASPVSCANVKISLSTDGGNTFPTVIAASTPNDGSETVIVPVGLNSTTARIKVEAVGNVFFDISGVNFTLQPGSCSYSINPTSQSFSGGSGSGSVNVTVSSGCGWTATSNAGWLTINSGTPGNGNGTVNYSVAVNNGAVRTGTMTIAGQTFTVTQATNCAAITLNPTTLSGGTVGTAYSSTTITASGGASPYTFTVSVGALPPGLSLSSGGLLAGNPTSAGTYNFTIQATDNTGCTGTRAYSVTINATGLMFYPLPRPVRLLDTRAGQPGCDAPGAPITGGTDRVQLARRTCDGLTIPANAVAITGNLTPVPNTAGWLTLYPSDAARPTVANSNFVPGEIVNNVYTVGLGNDGAFRIFASATTDVVFDVSGYFAPPAAGGLYFHPLPTPIRLLETRSGQPGCYAPQAPIPGGTSRTQPGRITCNGVTIPNTAQALVGNATVVFPATVGYITLFPATATQPFVANGNYVGGDIVNTPFTVGLGTDGAFKIFTTATTDMIVDVLGYYSPDATDVNGAGYLFYSLGAPVRLLDSRPGQPGCYTPSAPFNGGVEYSQQARGICGGQTVPANASAVLGNVTTVNPVGGYLTLWPSNVSRPLVAMSNFATGQIANRHFIVGLGPDGAFKLYSSGTTHLIFDLSGYFAP